ncbi:MAG: alpha/beta hydrolase [Acidobacteriota bacterium]
MRPKRMVLPGVLIIMAVVAAVVVVRAMENGMIFFPARYPEGVWDPGALGVVAEEHSFRTADGLTLYGWWFPARAPDGDVDADPPVLLWAHGNAGNVTVRAWHADVLAQHGLSVFVFDYRGYGKSEGRPDEEGIYIDAEAAYAYLTEQLAVPAWRIVLLGRSLGSAPAARLATRVPHAGLILVSPLPSAQRMARGMFGGLPVDLLVRARLPVTRWVAQRHTPLLVIHGDRDEVIPIIYGREVYEAAAEPKRFVELAGVGHNDVLSAGGPDYLDPLVAFTMQVVENGGTGQ